MCDRLVQEYKIWLNELLVILQSVCENVVPVGRPEEDIHWRTVKLWRMDGDLDGQLVSELLQYAKEGRELIAPVKEAIEFLKGEISEAEQIRLRRAYAAKILNSLQMLVNYYYIGKKFFPDVPETVEKYFEVDAAEIVRRVRTGTCVTKTVIALQENEFVAVTKKLDQASRHNRNNVKPFVGKHTKCRKASVAG